MSLLGSTNVGEQLPTGQLSVVPWRRTGVKYTNNEAYFDVVEEIDAIIDKSGNTVIMLGSQSLLCVKPWFLKHLVVFSSGSTITAEIQGVIDACVKLTGMPDLTLSFMVRLQNYGIKLSVELCYQSSTEHKQIHDYKTNPKSIKCLARNYVSSQSVNKIVFLS